MLGRGWVLYLSKIRSRAKGWFEERLGESLNESWITALGRSWITRRAGGKVGCWVERFFKNNFQ